MTSLNRRTVLGGATALGLGGGTPTGPAGPAGPSGVAQAQPAGGDDAPGLALSPWRPGLLDIHHLATGRGDAILVLAPDGTSLLIDAGASASPPRESVAPRPSAERRAGEWIARYAARQLRATGRTGLDYALVTHLHPDHYGDVTPDAPPAPDGDYVLTGISDVDAALGIGTLLDRGFPDYAYHPLPRTLPFARNYLSYVAARAASGKGVEQFQVGAGDQLGLRVRPTAYPTFRIRNLAANGEVWTGAGEEARMLFPPVESLPARDRPDENALSTALRLSYGAFDYLTVGDQTSTTFDGALPWMDVETPTAEVAGPVDAATAGHHALADAVGAEAVRLLRPRVWVVNTWHASHPGPTPLERMLSERLYPGPRDVFATSVLAENALVNERLLRPLASTEGHIVLRVDAGGDAFRVLVTENADESDRVKASFGPFPCA